MKRHFFIPLAFIIIIIPKAFSQSYIDIFSFSYQPFFSTYKANPNCKNKTENYALNIFFPKELKNNKTFLIRLNNELIRSTISPTPFYTSSLVSSSLPVGFQFGFKNEKWKSIAMIIPKIAADFKDKIRSNDFQLGGLFLQTYTYSEKLKFKAGLYYNREAFGSFFVPLVGIDWRATDRIMFYGILPTNYKLEFNCLKNKLYAGINFKSYTRSFRLSKMNGYDYVRYDEMQLKSFFDYFIYKKIVLFAEAGYTLGKNPLQYINQTKNTTDVNLIYTPLLKSVVFNIGIAYRIRFDRE
ncbi:MAG: hypothetical protein ABI315_00460 [Bacteroidia bacterium]